MPTTRTLVAASLLAGIALTGAGCVQEEDAPHPIAKVIPTAEQVKIKLPEQGATARTIGQLADYYVVTRNISRSLNGGAASILILVHVIVQYPVTTVEGDTYTWGPFSDALDPADYKLVVTAVADGSYDWSLEGRSKLVAGATFEAVVSGNGFPGATEGTGHGDFLLDFDASERVNPVDNDDVGSVLVTYDLAARHLEMDFATANDDGSPLAATYEYQESADGAGDLTFAWTADSDDEGTLAEDAVVRSRWLATGAGRSDVAMTGGDLADFQVTLSECWDASFGRVFYADSVEFQPTEGDVADCAFADQDLPAN